MNIFDQYPLKNWSFSSRYLSRFEKLTFFIENLLLIKHMGFESSIGWQKAICETSRAKL